MPPASITTGVSVSAHAAITRLPVAVEPVNATLSTPARHSAAPVSPRPVTTWKTGRSHHLGERGGQPGADTGAVLAGLEHHGVAGRQRVGDRAHRREHRVVPRADHARRRRAGGSRRSPPGWTSPARAGRLRRLSTFSACPAAQARWSTARAASSTPSACGLPISRCMTSASSAMRRAITRLPGAELLGTLVVRQGRPPGRRPHARGPRRRARRPRCARDGCRPRIPVAGSSESNVAGSAGEVAWVWFSARVTTRTYPLRHPAFRQRWKRARIAGHHERRASCAGSDRSDLRRFPDGGEPHDAHARGRAAAVREAGGRRAQLHPGALPADARRRRDRAAVPQAPEPLAQDRGPVGLGRGQAVRHRAPRAAQRAAQAGPGPRAARAVLAAAQHPAGPGAAAVGGAPDRGPARRPDRDLHEDPPRARRRHLGDAAAAERDDAPTPTSATCRRRGRPASRPGPPRCRRRPSTSLARGTGRRDAYGDRASPRRRPACRRR